MPENKKPPVIPDDPEQSKRFEEVARLLGADETGKAFDKTFKVVVKQDLPRPAKQE